MTEKQTQIRIKVNTKMDLRDLMYLGKLLGLPHFSIQNFLGPVDPRRAANPSYGILEVPVTNCNSLNLCSLLNRSIADQNHCITG